MPKGVELSHHGGVRDKQIATIDEDWGNGAKN